MRFAAALIAAALLAAPVGAQTAPPLSPVLADPPRDAVHPARNQQLLLPSHGEELNALLFLAAGAGPKPTMLLLHGLPGNERNLDLAQAMRRVGWNVLTFTYRGAWGSPGAFSVGNSIADAGAALAFLRTPEAAKAYGIDPRRLVIAGHSMGGLAATLTAADDRPAGAPPLAGLILLDAWNPVVTAQQVNAAGEKGRIEFVAGFEDFGHSLQGATPETVAAEVLARGPGWNLLDRVPRLARLPVLTIYASEGIAADNRALAEAIERQPGARVEAVELVTDHGFADHRIAVAIEMARWLAALAPK